MILSLPQRLPLLLPLLPLLQLLLLPSPLRLKRSPLPERLPSSSSAAVMANLPSPLLEVIPVEQARVEAEESEWAHRARRW